ncbi:MAG: Plug domain-containing protein [Cellvibrio sp.]|nr:Plug domain-containing protein [Cellvibrio sp.]
MWKWRTSSDGLNDSNDDFYIRGFKRNSIYLDGFRVGDSVGGKMLPANIERVEIIKAPQLCFMARLNLAALLILYASAQKKFFR